MFGYMTFNMKYYILSQIFYKKNWVTDRNILVNFLRLVIYLALVAII